MNTIRRMFEFTINLFTSLTIKSPRNESLKRIKDDAQNNKIKVKEQKRSLNMPKGSSWKKYTSFKYDNDQYIPAAKASREMTDKSMFCIHFAYIKTLKSLTNYFTKWIAKEKRSANSSWGMDNDNGDTIAYLKWKQMIWTNGLGYFVDHKGRWRKYTNRFSLSVEIAQLGNRNYSGSCYDALAERIHWALETFPNFRVWFVTGHEFIAPYRKSDPGRFFNWKTLFVNYVGVRYEFYDEYLSYLDDNKDSTVGNKVKSKQKEQRIRIAVNRIVAELLDKPKDYCF